MSEEASAVIAQAVAKGISLAVAESLTGGAVAADLVSIPGASAVFRGGIVAYDPVIKHDLLEVDAAALASGGAVTALVATQMAEGVAKRLSSDFAVATTGVAGPDPEPVSGQKPGTVFIAVAGTALGTLVRELSLTGDRAEIRAKATRAALQALADGIAIDD
ncbi:MAG: CinA family protein [Microbacteriaceae bacterium]|jgi:nicotinamide-nucleotide amidase|nr:CinA family protein [Microbacteriaceae bacterium]MBT5248021.1 CinA family protein [Microbacteriaceae bacterium]MBT5616852.1 CinA family protein [Microbacteriaceae bacterium]MBT5730171.1 CinA family protein [Microbacteriaceae bacterium]MBT7802912.1 CinA family protein [Microbacteriaceae bacterium]